MSKHESIIIILGGDIKKTENKWHSNSLSRDRVSAAYWLYQENLRQTIIASAGKSRVKGAEKAPPVASVMKRELVERGIPEGLIIEEKNSKSTFDQLRKLRPVINRLQSKTAKIISSRWHLPRVRAFIKTFPGLKSFYKPSRFKLVSAENIVKKHEPMARERIQKLYRSQLMKKVIRREKGGIKDIKSGRYRFNRV